MLKDFQRRTVDLAARELFGPGGTRRFLVADEVGLGKTVVARGLIARAIELHDEEGRERTDIVYVCSNGDIARQNVRRLNVLPDQDFAHATRLTLLPEQLKDFAARPLNFVSFTPGTSFDLRSSEGIGQERVIVLRMLQKAWGRQFMWDDATLSVFAGSARVDRFLQRAGNTNADDLDPSLTRSFVEAVLNLPDHDELKATFRDLTKAFRRLQHHAPEDVPRELRNQRRVFVGRMRVLLARACIGALRPRLVILDEFQRFKHLLDAESEEGALAQALFEEPDVAVLLLSATPYKMYTRGDEDEDHYADFLETIGFLRQDSAVVRALQGDIDAFRRGILQGDTPGHDVAHAAKQRIERELRRVMSRNERVSVSPDANAMIETRTDRAARLTPDDVRRFRALRLLGNRVKAPGAMSYWESLPYPLSNLDGYHFWKQFMKSLDQRPQPFADLDLPSLCVNVDRIRDYAQIDAGNVRMRTFEEDTVGSGMWRLLWLPPSLPYYGLSGFHAVEGLTPTKRLVFSKWRAVPRAIATHLSFAAERQMAASDPSAENTAENRKGHRPLVFGSGEQIRGMRTLALILPSAVLAELGDPLSVARQLHRDPEHTSIASLEDVRTVVRASIAQHLSALAAHENPNLGSDERWYAVAPMLLDDKNDAGTLRSWLTSDEPARVVADLDMDGEDGEPLVRADGLQGDLALLSRYLEGSAALGAMPIDLTDALTDLAIAGPGTCALRAISRVTPGPELSDPSMRTAALRISDAIRTVFNSREVGILLRDLYGGSEAELWRAALAYCADGNLQSVLDEWFHMLHDGLSTQVVASDAMVEELSRNARDAIQIKTVNLTAQTLAQKSKNGIYRTQQVRMRANFALRFGDEQSETDTTLMRGAAIRTAFNSPFRPFILATTSVGQEGLDFHVYCHAVVHWNLPRNPVDLEQREGRVNRYKNHAVRRNIADVHRAAAMESDGDPWSAMFDIAVEEREGDELVPFWIFPRGPARIERHVPALPLSREEGLHESLKRSTAAYRLVFGQPRQDDLLSYLEGSAGIDLSALTIDLRP